MRLVAPICLYLVLLCPYMAIAQAPLWNDTNRVRSLVDQALQKSKDVPQLDSLLVVAINQCRQSRLKRWEVRLLNYRSHQKVANGEMQQGVDLIRQAIRLADTDPDIVASVDYRDALVQIAFVTFYLNNYDSSFYWAQRATEHSRAAGDPFNESVALTQQAINISVRNGDTTRIDSIFRQAIRLAAQTQNRHDDAMALHNYAYYKKAFPVQDLKASLDILLTIQQFSQAPELTKELATPYWRVPHFYRGTHVMLLRELGYGYFYLGDFKQAIAYLQECTQRGVKDGHLISIPFYLIQQAMFETYVAPVERIRQLHDSATTLFQRYQGKPDPPVPYLYYVKGWLAEQEADWNAADRHYRAAIRYSEAGINENYIGLFRSAVKSKHIPRADSLYQTIHTEIDSTLIQYYRIYFLKELPAYYRLKNDEVAALQAGLAYYALKDSMAGISQYIIAHQVEKQFQTREKDRLLAIAERETTLQKKQIALRGRQNLFLAGGLLLLSGGILLLARNIKLKKKQAIALNQKNAQIETLIRELHHRVKNNLQVVSGLLSLQSNRLEDDVAREAMNEGRSRVDAMAMIHQKLYMDSDLAEVDIRDYLDNLSVSLANSFGYDKSNIETRVSMKQPTLDIDRSIPIGLIVNELITNAFKHAFSDTSHPRVTITLSDNPDGSLDLEVADNGKGIAGQTKSNNSFGMKLVHTLVKQLNASLHQHYDKGTVFQIRINA